MTPSEQTSAFTLHNPTGLYDPSQNGYSHTAAINADAQLIFLAGQGGEDMDGRLPDSFAEQAVQALKNVRTALGHHGADVGDVFKLTLLVVDHDQEKLREWVCALDDAWGNHAKPVCTLIPVPRLALDGMRVEIEAAAAITRLRSGD